MKSNLKAIITQGISASGKTTWAEQFVKDNPDWVNINRDDIRAKLFCNGNLDWSVYKFNKSNEQKVTEYQHKLLEGCAKQGKNVIISDTNLNPLNNCKLTLKLNKLGYEVDYKVFDIDLMEALKRDARRVNGVGYEVITRQYKQFCELLYLEDYHDNTKDKPKAICIDIDGTIADMTGVRKPFDWHLVGNDNPREEVISMVETFVLNKGYIPIFLSGRDSVCMEETKAWIDKYLPDLQGDYYLFMREQGDMRKDTIVKKEMFNKYIDHNFSIQLVFDDRPSVCRMWMYEKGLKVINVGNPYLEF